MNLNIVEKVDDRVAVRRVLISVSDKTGLETLVAALVDIIPAVQFYSTGGTHAAIAAMLGEDAERHLVSVSSYTGQPEMQGGLVKTLDFRIYLGLLSETYNPSHQKDLDRAGAHPFDLVVVNLYPFARTVADSGVTPEEARTNIDIGGPCMIRAAAKNYLRVAIVTDPSDYQPLCDALRRGHGAIGLEDRFRLMRKAFAHTAGYDAAIRDYLDRVAFEQVRGIYRT